VHQAIADLDRQATQLRLGGRTFVVDVVMQAPERFSSTVRTAACWTTVIAGMKT
jgi:LacI family transcriptional regulator